MANGCGGNKKVCETCGGDEVLHSTDWVNGREVEVSEPCGDCCGDGGDYDDREEDEKRLATDAEVDDMRADQHERYVRAFGPSFFLTLLVLAMFGCTTTPGNAHPIHWSTGKSDSSGVTDPVVCGDVISRPCPFVLFATTLWIDEMSTAATLTWGDATGGTTPNGVPAENLPTYVEGATVDAAGNLELKQRGDEGGLRSAATLSPTGGDITWLLLTVAGHTTFHLTIDEAQ
jgi:hypothetical protein